MRKLRYCLGRSLESDKTRESVRQEANVTSVLDLIRRRLQWFEHVCGRKKERRRHQKSNQMRIKGEIGDVQSIDGRTQPGIISNPVPSVKRVLKTIK